MFEGAKTLPAVAPETGLTAASPEASKKPTIRHSFIRAVGQALRCNYRLGDLLVRGGLINEGQLLQALSVQKETREPLGTILVRKGAISSVQLYRKLAEQWCLRVSAAGVALMVETMTPAAAMADDTVSNPVRLAAAFSPAAVKPLAAPAPNALFGSTEIKSTNISAFTKWTSVMKRFEDQMKTSAASAPRVQMWKNSLNQLKGKSAREQIEGVNNYINSVRYVEDKDNYGKSDQWATPTEFLAKGGDCEDFAIAKFASLRALGFTSDQMRIAIVQDKIKRIAHAILIVYTDDGGTLVLDNQNKQVADASAVTRYKPVFSISSSNWWLHRVPAGA